MRQNIFLLLAGLFLLVACSAGGAGIVRHTPEYEEPAYRFEEMTAGEVFQAEDGTRLAHYEYRLLTLAVDNPEALSPGDRAAAERNVENFNARAAEVLESAVAYGRGLAEAAEEARALSKAWTADYCDETSAQGYMGGEIISIRTDTWGYTGGAHGYSYTAGYTFDLRTGQFIDPVQLADDPAAFQAGAAALLVEKAESCEDRDAFWQDYAEIITRWNEGTVLFDGEGMRVIYSRYELGPYSMGEVELRLNWEELEPLLGPDGMERLGAETAGEG